MDPLHAIIHKASRSVHRDSHDAAAFRRTLDALTGTPAAAPARARFPRAFAWALVAVFVAGSGATVTYASSRALPGEALYAMKVKVVEPAETALALSAEAKADVAVAHLERRFKEAAALSAAGTLEDHDETLAVAAEKDLAIVDREEEPVARARFEALASVYAPSIRLENAERSRFAIATRLAKAPPRIEDRIAKEAAREQIAIASQRSLVASKGQGSAAVSARLQAADRFSKAASAEFDKGSFQAAFQLSGDAVRAATEAQVIAGIASSTTSTTSTAPVPSSTTSTASSSSQGSSSPSGPGSSTPAGAFLRGLFR